MDIFHNPKKIPIFALLNPKVPCGLGFFHDKFEI